MPNSKPKATDTTKEKPSTATSERVTELATEDMPIDKVAKDDGTDSAENSANKDVAEGMKAERAKKAGKEPDNAGPSFLYG